MVTLRAINGRRTGVGESRFRIRGRGDEGRSGGIVREEGGKKRDRKHRGEEKGGAAVGGGGNKRSKRNVTVLYFRGIRTAANRSLLEASS